MWGGEYRCWFDGELVHWTYPSRFYGRNDSCAIADIAEFLVNGINSDSMICRYLVLKDGAKKPINDYCYGDQAAFVERTFGG